MAHLAAFFHDELQDGRDVFVRKHHEAAYHRLADFLNYAGVGELIGIVDAEDFAIRALNLINDRGVGRDDVHVELATQTLDDDLHVQQSEKSATEAKAQRHARLGHELEGSVVELKLGHGCLEVLEISRVDGINAAEDHGLHDLEAGQGLLGRLAGVGESIANLHFRGGLDISNDIADVAGDKFFLGKKLWLLRLEDSDLLDLVV